ncbi:Conserved oligomeric Golgi complex subunit 2 [Frankliniella fusca]|uniref:Conserved oligomeric Golgi complex subunit 2 n=1 Tax=Frankliniella fusca TaxID=407009 RepID=A0AAE1LKI0_9NEOP|nr:Conserved oligomeric Golgi complex subunit 2 [Frankliniella fusca]
MDLVKDTHSLPDGPKDLCFSKYDFMKTPFSVDEFLQNQRKYANLEIMRDDLGVYLKVLRSSMIELINKDYADFVNLSSNLIGLDKAINKIQVPLGQLKEEVGQVKSNLDEAIDEVSACLEKQRFLQRTKRSLHSLSYVQQSLHNLSSLLQLPDPKSLGMTHRCKSIFIRGIIYLKTSSPSHVVDKAAETQLIEEKSDELSGPDLVERVASELNQLHFRMSHCKDIVSEESKNRLSLIKSVLMRGLDKLFLRSLHKSDFTTIKRSLCVYESLGKEREAEELFRKQVVAKELHDVISETSLQSNPSGLKGVYREILNFIDIHMKDLLEFTSHRERPPAVSGFYFLVNSYWPEVEQRLELHMPSIFAPGNPDNFFQNFSETQNFLSELEQKCGSQAEVRRLHQHPQYLSFLQLWNLPVYFQIRFQEIGGSLETAIIQWPQNLKSDDVRFKLAPTVATWSAAQMCWNPNIFLHQLTHRFWKLTLQVFARYFSWTGEAVREKWTAENSVNHLSFLVWLFCDIQLIAGCLPEIIDVASNRLQNSTKLSMSHFSVSLQETTDQLLSRLPVITERIVSEVTGVSGQSLRQVNDIPRLFRRTNRDIPTKPCSYVSALLAPLKDFFKTYGNIVSSIQLKEWLTLICSSITCQYYICVSDVLTSVQKTEESLRRLKKMRERSTQAALTEGRGHSDDDKIRMQLAIDVNSFIEEIEKLGVERSMVERLADLTALVQNAIQFQPQAQS